MSNPIIFVFCANVIIVDLNYIIISWVATPNGRKRNRVCEYTAAQQIHMYTPKDVSCIFTMRQCPQKS